MNCPACKQPISGNALYCPECKTHVAERIQQGKIQNEQRKIFDGTRAVFCPRFSSLRPLP